MSDNGGTVMYIGRAKGMYEHGDSLYAVTSTQLLKFRKMRYQDCKTRVCSICLLQYDAYIANVRMATSILILSQQSVIQMDMSTGSKFVTEIPADIKIRELAVLAGLSSGVLRISDSGNAWDFFLSTRSFTCAAFPITHTLSKRLWAYITPQNVQLHLVRESADTLHENHLVEMDHVIGYREPYFLYQKAGFLCGYDVLSKRKVYLQMALDNEHFWLYKDWICISKQHTPNLLELWPLRLAFEGAYKFSIGDSSTNVWMHEAVFRIIASKISQYAALSSVLKTRNQVTADLAQQLVRYGGATSSLATVFVESYYDLLFSRVMQEKWQRPCTTLSLENQLRPIFYQFDGELQHVWIDGDSLFCQLFDGETDFFVQIM